MKYSIQMYAHCIIVILSVLTKVAVPAVINQNDEGVDGLLIKKSFIRKQAAQISLVCPKDAEGSICSADCQTLLLCNLGNTVPSFNYKCSYESPSHPYCVPGTHNCSDIVDYNNTQCIATQTSSFLCTNTGYYPDPSDCTIYHLCTREIQETYRCPPRHVFDATHIKCKPKHHSKCNLIDCTDSHNQFVQYPGQKSYYAFCGDGGITMFKCGNTKHFQFNPKTLTCEFICKSTGWFPDFNNCQQFYECYKNKKDHSRGHKWYQSRIQTCPQHFKFDAKKQHCVVGECKETTKTTTTTVPVPNATPNNTCACTTDNTTEISTLPIVSTTTTTTTTNAPPLIKQQLQRSRLVLS